MKIKLYLPIKTVLFITALFAIFLLIIFLNASGFILSYVNDSIQKDLNENIELVLLSLNDLSLKGKSIEAIDELADTIGVITNSRATIISSDGTVVGDSERSLKDLTEMENHAERKEIREAFDKGFGQSKRFSATLRKEFAYIARLFGPPDDLSVIRLAVLKENIYTTAMQGRKILAYGLISIFIGSVLIGYAVLYFVSYPIRKIAAVTKLIANGDFSRHLTVDSGDEIADLSGSINLMSEQIREKLEQANTNRTRLEAVFQSMVEGVMVVGREGQVLLMNRRLQEFFNISVRPEGKQILEIVRNVEINEMVEDIIKRGMKNVSKEIHVLFPETKDILVNGRSVVHDNVLNGAVFVFHDITEQRRLEQVRKDFVANVSHELRTPVSTIKGYAETLLSGAMNDKAHAEDFIRIIYEDADRLAKLINDLLDLSKIESGYMKINKQRCFIKPLIAKVLLAMKKLADEKGITVTVNVEPEAEKIYADEAGLGQVFYNLIENAIKYNIDRGKINITAVSKSNKVEIKISDSGVGIPEGDLPRIFERFYRVDKAHSRELGGTGLGLAIVKHIVQAHGGDIRLESREGEGTTFMILLDKA